MCGRFATANEAIVVKTFKISDGDHFECVFNAAPSQRLPVILERQGLRQLRLFLWGLLPSYAKSKKTAYTMINARLESVTTKPSFRNAFKKRRCIIPASGFYEWKTDGIKKQPYYIHPTKGDLFALAGLWEMWRSVEGEVLESFAILTTEANDLVRPIHARMPVILDEKTYDSWLAESTPEKELVALVVPWEAAKMAAYPVSTFVNSPSHNSRQCLEPL